MMRACIAIAAVMVSTNAAADATCDAIAKVIDNSQRLAAFYVARQSSSPLPDATYEAKIARELDLIQANIALGQWNKCAPWRDPIAIPGIYAKAAAACGHALREVRKQQLLSEKPIEECFTAKWERDPP